MSRVHILKCVSIVLLAANAWVPLAFGQPSLQQTNIPQAQMNSSQKLYDNFSRKWLDPTKWQAVNPNCWGNILECVREIQDGKLRLALRSLGASNSDSGVQWSESEVYFLNPNAVTSITADVNVRFRGTACPTNDTGPRTHTQNQISGNFFNTGTGDPSDDMSVILMIWVDTVDPVTRVNVVWGNPWPAPFTIVPVANYPLGTELTAALTWDRANHQFVAKTRVKDDEGPWVQVEIPYSVSDTTPPANPMKALQTSLETLNCTSAKTFGQVESTFDNVIVNR